MPEKELSSEELKKLTPEQRIKRLRELEQQRKQELEETKKKVEEELQAAEALIAQSVEEIDEEEKAIEEAKEKLKELHFSEDEDLEAKLAAEKAQKPPEQQGSMYESKPNLYNALPEAVQELSRLYGNSQWNEQDRQHYQHAKEVVQKASEYNLTSEKLAEELGLASAILNKFKYKT